MPSDPTTVTVSKDQAGRYFVSCLCEFEPTLLPVNDKKVGIDVGIKDLFVTSDGFKSGNPRHTAKYAAKLAKYQRRLAKKKLGGKNRQKAKLRDPNSRWYVEFHPLITEALKSVDYRQYNIEVLMKHASQLTRWIHKYLVIKFVFASINTKFEIKYSTIANESHLLDSISRKRDAVKRVCEAMDELKKNGVISSYSQNKEMDANGILEDATFQIYPSITLMWLH